MNCSMTDFSRAWQLLCYGKRAYQSVFIFRFYDQFPDGVLIGCSIVTAIARLR
jgi:hypothetical protein